jgi:hypothetical protein
VTFEIDGPIGAADRTVPTEFTDRLRSVTRVAMTGHTLREVSAEIGLGHTVLHRFLAGRPPSGQTVDSIVRWLDARGWRL